MQLGLRAVQVSAQLVHLVRVGVGVGVRARARARVGVGVRVRIRVRARVRARASVRLEQAFEVEARGDAKAADEALRAWRQRDA